MNFFAQIRDFYFGAKLIWLVVYKLSKIPVAQPNQAFNKMNSIYPSETEILGKKNKLLFSFSFSSGVSFWYSENNTALNTCDNLHFVHNLPSLIMAS